MKLGIFATQNSPGHKTRESYNFFAKKCKHFSVRANGFCLINHLNQRAHFTIFIDYVTGALRKSPLRAGITSMPDYFDFAYFSFVLGMTFQVSDVQITSLVLRRLALLLALLSFVYHTTIIALSINIISGVIGK
jgi:uncharacterized membrane protein